MKSIDMARNTQTGFTLIETMIVVTIIGVLAAVAIPLYQNYVIKTKVGSALSSVATIQTAIAMCIQEQSGLSSDCTTAVPAARIPAFTATKEVASVEVLNGTLTLTFAPGIASDVDGSTIVMTPLLTSGAANLGWRNVTTVTNPAANAAIVKNNPPV